MSVLQRIVTAIRNWWSRVVLRKPEPEPIPEVEVSRNPGLTCPECGSHISVTMSDLLHVGAVACTNCHLVLEVDMQQSRGALAALAQLESSLHEAESLRRA